jgi:hypothetical protein
VLLDVQSIINCQVLAPSDPYFRRYKQKSQKHQKFLWGTVSTTTDRMHSCTKWPPGPFVQQKMVHCRPSFGLGAGPRCPSMSRSILLVILWRGLCLNSYASIKTTKSLSPPQPCRFRTRNLPQSRQTLLPTELGEKWPPRPFFAPKKWSHRPSYARARARPHLSIIAHRMV